MRPRRPVGVKDRACGAAPRPSFAGEFALDPGATYTLKQVGADTVLEMGAGNQMILVGVSMSSLTPGSIFFG